ncbi:helix-turn-helix transcriptional regulator [Sphingomonas sp.]|uniref:helix-turn-helix transcriptional regulator n=1 Tax=Sphingomonas sp. TaxID=28214 RepID=UPI0025E1E1F0|nr:helix-turn-helix transcriptional regulator [Sphingomonas sp.]
MSGDGMPSSYQKTMGCETNRVFRFGWGVSWGFMTDRPEVADERGRMEAEGGDADLQRLTEAQKECLRLVIAGFRTKEIAHRLGIGVDAVNKRLAGAKAALGSPSRFHAARLLASHEAGSAYHSAVGSFSAVAFAEHSKDIVAGELGIEEENGEFSAGCCDLSEKPPFRESPASETGAVDPDDRRWWFGMGARCAGAFAIASVLGASLRFLVRS